MELIPKEDLLSYLKNEMELPEYSRLYRHITYMNSIKSEEIYAKALDTLFAKVKKSIWDVGLIYVEDVRDLINETKCEMGVEQIWQKRKIYQFVRKILTADTRKSVTGSHDLSEKQKRKDI